MGNNVNKLLGRLLLALWICSCSVLAQVPIPIGFLVSPAQAAGATYAINEQFEATGYDVAGWSATATGVDPDYTGVVLAGSQSLRLRDLVDQGTITNNFTASGTVWQTFDFETFTAPISTRNGPWFISNSSGTKVARVRIDGNGTGAFFSLYNGTITALGTPGDISLSTKYNVWVKYVKGSGANGVSELYWSTTSTRPGSPQLSVTTGDATTDASNITYTCETFEEIIDDSRTRIDGGSIND